MTERAENKIFTFFNCLFADYYLMFYFLALLSFRCFSCFSEYQQLGLTSAKHIWGEVVKNWNIQWTGFHLNTKLSLLLSWNLYLQVLCYPIYSATVIHVCIVRNRKIIWLFMNINILATVKILQNISNFSLCQM